MIAKPNLFGYTATIYFKGGGARAIDYDALSALATGFLFVREDGGCDFVSAHAMDCFETVKNHCVEPVGAA